MSRYAVFFDYENQTYRLPVNPGQIEVKSTMSAEKYKVLKLGEVIVPNSMDLKEYSFECELPHTALHYVQTIEKFKDADYYINLFEKWRKTLVPVRFIASNGIGEDINTLVLINELTITEKAGEEGDKYVSFGLTEYKEYGKKSNVVTVSSTSAKIVSKPIAAASAVNPKNKGTHTVVKNDSLWKIAKTYYGNGGLYAKIYNANKDKLKNPSLIYPGQVLTIPG